MRWFMISSLHRSPETLSDQPPPPGVGSLRFPIREYFFYHASIAAVCDSNHLSKKAAATSSCWNKSGSSPNPMTLAAQSGISPAIIWSTSHPGFSRFDGPYQRMLGFVIVLGGMFVLRRVAAAHMSAFQAQPQVYPRISKFDALLTNVNFGVRNLDLVEMSARVRHLVPPDPPQRSRALRSHFASVAAAS